MDIFNDFEKAKANRERIANPSRVELKYWKEIEGSIRATPTWKPLPANVPIGQLPYLDRRELKSNREVNEDE